MTPTHIYVSIAVFKGDPVDYQKYRHTALLFRFNDDSPPLVIHVVGPPMGYQLQVRDNYDPTRSRTFAKEVQAGWLTVPMTKAQLVSLISQNSPDNSNQEFNCQTWVGAVLQRLCDMRYMSQEDGTKGVNGMVDATMEAEDEPGT